ncbi:FimV/HubP family polar landmark protein [Solimonas terrae]|uniref:Tetratricopeptide repeat protein n=1 Tax=Solimonas terrae TaxID=1396819 RepID=A0A6M2BVQ1_9GAMM|nr:FimV/HubP family polar landmark protein [Solimonas terrae]NGY06213.1 tetratricopeptide repeat protein [Solimonas terrae]
MKRIVSSVAAVAAGLWLSSASALGLGEIQVRSHLNERFDAVIPLTSVSADAAADLRVGLASAEDFASAGLDRADYLSSLQFSINTDGAPRIEVSSDKIEREPFVQMLLEVHGGGNRILRQYTVLLDPPGLAKAAPAAPQPTPAPVAIGQAADSGQPVFEEVQHPVPPPDERPLAPRSEPVKPAAKSTKPAAAASPATTAAPAADGSAVAPTNGELYGPVKPAETLWSIATRVRGSSDVSMDQALLALYNSNPRAFDGGINGLNRGAMLRIPTVDDMRALNAVDAHREIARLRGLPQTAATSSAPHRQKPVIEPTRITPPPPPPASTINSSSGKKADAGAAVTPSPAAAAPASASEAAASTSSTSEVGSAATPAEPTAASEPASSEPNADSNAAVATAAPAAQAADGGETAAPTPVEEAPAAAPPPAPKKRPADGGLLETLLIPLIVGLLILFVIAYLFSRWRARRAPPAPAPAATPKRMPLSTPTPVAPAAPAAKAAAAAAAASTQKLTPQEELDRLQASLSEATRDDIPTQQLQTQQLSADEAEQTQAVAAELPPVDFDLTGQFATQTVQIDLDANDPVSEADFHLAYGLYDEAALLLRQAAEKDPSRTDIGIKLAETYFAAGKTSEFEQTAAALKPKLAGAEWQKLAIMGQQLDPESTLFKDAPQGSLSTDLDPGFDSHATAPADDMALDFSFDAEPAKAPEAAAPAMAMTADNGLDFKLDDLELPSLDLGKGEVPAAAPSATVADDNALEFDLGGFDMPAETAAGTPAAKVAGEHEASSSLDFDLGDFDASPATPQKPAPSAAAPSAEATIEEFDFDTVSTDAADIAGDEASTKLDLARAYVEMGDHEMARSLLDEVLTQGNAQQKQDARALVERLA